jgi:hypothetical protein
MLRLLAYVFTLLLLLQSFGRELLVLHFAVSQATITVRFCVKAQPRLHCHGNCYLATQLRRAENGPAKAPAGELARVKFEVVAPGYLHLAAPSWAGPGAALRYAPAIARLYATAPRRSIFHPPA